MKLNIIAPINDRSYGIVAINIVSELIKMGHEISLFPIGKPYCHHRYESDIKKALEHSDHFSSLSPCIRIWHQFDMSMFVGKGRHIGFPIFELDTFTDKEKHHLNSCDTIFVCSKWAKGIIEQNGITVPTYVVPLGVDNTIFYPEISKRSPTIFLNVGKWEKRKGHDVLVKMFNRAFTSVDNVELWMMCHNPFLTEEEDIRWKRLYKDSPLGDKIRFIPWLESDTDVANVMRQADCGVFPSRAEGWNLENIEMLSCGKEIITTDYSAHTEFCTKHNSCLVPITELELAHDNKWFFNQGKWGKIDNNVEELFVQYMREINVAKQYDKLNINTEGIETAKNFSWKNTAQTIVNHLSGV